MMALKGVRYVKPLVSIFLLFWGILLLYTFFTPTADAKKDKFPDLKIDKGKIGNVEPIERDEFEKIIKNLPPKDIKLLDDHVPLLFINNSMGPVAVSKDSESVRMEWATVVPISGIQIRVRNSPFTAPCPANGTAMDRGIDDLNAADGFASPDKIKGPFRYGTYILHIDDPSYRTGISYYFQGCEIRGDAFDNDPVATFTGEGTNIVQMNIVGALPDLVVTDIQSLTSRSDMGRLWIKVDDLNRESEPEILGTEFDYVITAKATGLGSSSRITSSGRYNLPREVWGWMLPGAETPGDPSDDFRLPDNGRFYNVRVWINQDRTVPETRYTNNSFEKRLKARGKKLWVILDRIHVRDDCDRISPGDWIILFGALQGRSNEVRGKHPSDGSMDVDSGETKNIKMGLPLTVVDDLPIEIAIAAEDCDMDGPIAFLIPVPIVWGLAIGSWAVTCGGEEWNELSGPNHDFTGWGNLRLSPEEWQSDREFEITTVNGDCGRSAFTATIRIERPYESGE